MAHGNRWFSQLETSIYGWDFSMAMLNNQMVFLLSKFRFSHSLMISPLFMFFFPLRWPKVYSPSVPGRPRSFCWMWPWLWNRPQDFQPSWRWGPELPTASVSWVHHGSTWGPASGNLAGFQGRSSGTLSANHGCHQRRLGGLGFFWHRETSRDPHFGLKRRDLRQSFHHFIISLRDDGRDHRFP